MILMQANPFLGQLEAVGNEKQDFFGPWNGNEQSECYLGPKSHDFQGPALPMALEMDGEGGGGVRSGF